MSLPREIGPIHFIGIGGIGMCGIAEVMDNLGYNVQGSDASDERQCRAPARERHQGHDRPQGGEYRRRRRGRGLDRDQAR